MESSGKILMVFGVIIFLIGLVLTIGPRLPFRLGRLPGDIAYERNGVSVFIPITSMILLSIILSVVGWLVSRSNR